MPPKISGWRHAGSQKNESRREVLGALADVPATLISREISRMSSGRISWVAESSNRLMTYASATRHRSELLDALAARLVSIIMISKKLIRDICASRSCNSAPVPMTQTQAMNAISPGRPSGAFGRRFCWIASVKSPGLRTSSGVCARFKGGGNSDGNAADYFLTTFGRASTATVCSCETKVDPNLSQALHLLNGETIQNKIEQGRIVKSLLKSGKLPTVIDDLYLRCLGREPTTNELAQLNGFQKIRRLNR